jgi:hypothetical protein
METSQRFSNIRAGFPEQGIMEINPYNFTPELIYGGADTFDTYQGEDEETLGILEYLENIGKDIGGRSILSQVLRGAGSMIDPTFGVIGGITGLLKGGDLFNAPYMPAGSTYDTPIMRRAGFTPEMLDKMNAAGGYYSAPARAQRNLTNRFTNMIDRVERGLPISERNLIGIGSALGLDGRGRLAAARDFRTGMNAPNNIGIGGGSSPFNNIDFSNEEGSTGGSGSFDGAASMSDYSSDPTGYSGSF